MFHVVKCRHRPRNGRVLLVVRLSNTKSASRGTSPTGTLVSTSKNPSTSGRNKRANRGCHWIAIVRIPVDTDVLVIVAGFARTPEFRSSTECSYLALPITHFRHFHLHFIST